MDVSGFFGLVFGLVLDFVGFGFGFGLRFGVEVNEYCVADLGMRFDVVGGLIGSVGLYCSIGSVVQQFPCNPLDPSFRREDSSWRYSGYQTRCWNVRWAGDRCL